MQVLLDGVPVGTPQGWTSRADLTSFFVPASTYPGVNTALAVFGLDLSNASTGLHTIAWLVTDNLGNMDGVGSRFFSVEPATSLMAGVVESRPRSALHIDEGEPVNTAALAVIVGPDVNAGPKLYFPSEAGVIEIEAAPLERVELRLTPGSDGVLRTSSGNEALPVGSQLDPSTGVFTWQPGAGFIGAYDLRFIGADGRRDVRIVIRQR